MNLKYSKLKIMLLAKTTLTFMCYFAIFFMPTYAQEHATETLEIYLDEPETEASGFFIDTKKHKKLDFEKNIFDEDNIILNPKEEINLDGSIEIDLRKDENNLFYDTPRQSFDVRVGFSKEVNSFIDINTNMSLQNFNNYSQNSYESANISNLNLSTDIIPKHKLYIGQTRLYDGNSPNLELFRMIENQYGLRNFDTLDDIDLKIAKTTGFINYSAGAYNLNRTQDQKSLRNNSSVSGGWAAFNPFQDNAKLGKLQMGGGYFTNRHAVKSLLDQKDTYSVFSGYNYKRFSLRGELMRKQSELYEKQHSDSLHLNNKFAITDNLNLTTGFEQYQETHKRIHDLGVEYSIKENKQTNEDLLKLELNASFVRSDEDKSNNSERFGIKTKFMF